MAASAVAQTPARAAFASNPRAIHDWLREGNTATATEIAAALSINFHSVKVALARLRRDGYVEVSAWVPGARTPKCVYAAARDDRWLWCQRARPAAGIVGRAMNRRTPIELAWQGLAA